MIKYISSIFILVAVFLGGLLVDLLASQLQEMPDNPIEVGTVHWSRDLQQAQEKSGRSGKPIFLLFQEIPGCIGCQNFGSEVLAYPLLVEAIENEFIPVLVYNNRMGGQDETLLKRFKEPSWNYQVIRFLNSQGGDIIPRKDKIWSIGAVAARMIEVLEIVGREVPLYLLAIAEEQKRSDHGLAGFAMACFWTGEYKLGKIDGVIKTQAGWYDHREVTLVTYNKKKMLLDHLLERAAQEDCAQTLYVPKGTHVQRWKTPAKILRLEDYKVAKATDQKKKLSSWPEFLKLGDLTSMQKTKINSLLPDDREGAITWLSPRQLAKLQSLWELTGETEL